MSNTEKEERIREELAKRDSFPKKDYTDKKARAAALQAIVGHPLYTLTKENRALTALLNAFKANRSEELFSQIQEISAHYAKKGDLLYPLLKVKYGVAGPSDLMWTEEDEVRDELNALCREAGRGEEWNTKLDAVLKNIERVLFKEENIFFPICAVNFTDGEWYGIYRDSKDYDMCFGVSRDVWEEAEKAAESALPETAGTDPVSSGSDAEIVMPGGHLTPEQLTALLNTIPMEITFVDADNINRFFNEGPKVFKRPGMAIGRDVFSCHPPKIEPMVRRIIDDFRAGRRDEVQVWMEKKGRTMLVRYMAVRAKEGNYVGTVELVQDMEFAREHFQRQ